MPLMITLPQEIENFIIKTAHKEQITQSELIQRALISFLNEQNIQNYKDDLKLIEQGKIKPLTADEIFSNVRKRLKK